MLLHAAPGARAWEWQLPRGFPVPVVPADNPMSAIKVELGRRLFVETRLSSTGRYACASCHDPARAFTDGRGQAIGSNGDRLRRGALPLANVGYNASLGWASPDITTLEAQMRRPMFNEHPPELGMAGREAAVLALLSADPTYAQLFAAAFPGAAPALTLDNLVRALAAYERTLISGRSAFDRYVFDDDRLAMSDAARRGLALFYSQRAGCGSCHSGLNFNGPLRSEQTPDATAVYANTGLYAVAGRGGYPAADTGLMEQTGNPRDDGRFRVPSLRNVARTAPYMHDGSVATLEEVIDHYDRGGRGALPVAPDSAATIVLRDPLVRPLHLSDDEKRDLLAFLGSLDDPPGEVSPP